MGLRLTLMACALGACSPFGGGAFECSLDTECNGGKCSDGFCSFADPNCMSGFRYGELSGPRSGQCVGDQQTGDAGIDMALIDTMVIPDAAPECRGAGIVTPCFTTAPSTPVTVDANINTDTSPLCDTDSRNTAWCVIAGSTVTVANTVTVIGGRPLVLYAATTITVNGTLDIGSHRTGGIVGAGTGGPTSCNAGTAGTSGGGGAGGSFGGLGGDGGDRADMTNTGGTPGAVVTLGTVVRGGCAGQNGSGTGAGTGGPGGGAVALLADTSINVIGTINASGAGGNGAANNSSGGGGGGSGGLIILDAPTVMATGSVFANGAGGGAGSGSGTPGQPGSDPTSADTAAAGGLRGAATFSSFGGSGGTGSVSATLTGGAAENGLAGTAGGGGAGGGGAGIIKLYRATAIGGGGLISPPST